MGRVQPNFFAFAELKRIVQARILLQKEGKNKDCYVHKMYINPFHCTTFVLSSNNNKHLLLGQNISSVIIINLKLFLSC